MIKYVWLLVLIAGFGSAKAHAQFGECDPLNTQVVFTYQDGQFYPNLDDYCRNTPSVQTPIDCNTLGVAFVTYSDITVLSDGTIMPFAASEDFSPNGGTASVQMHGTVTLPNGQQLFIGGVSQHGYVMSHTSFTPDSSNDSEGTIATSHELNWRKCDGDGTIVLTSLQFKIAGTKSETDYNNPRTNTTVAADGVYCAVHPWCTSQSSPPACNPSYVTQKPIIVGGSASCQPYYYTFWLAERPDSSVPWNCFPIPPGNNAFSTLDPSLQKCTKQ